MNKILDYFVGRIIAQTLKIKELGQELTEALEEATDLQKQIYSMQVTVGTMSVPMHKYYEDIARLESRLKDFTDAKVYTVVAASGGEVPILATRYVNGTVVITI